MKETHTPAAGPAWLRGARTRPRLIISLLVGLLAGLAVPASLQLHPVTRMIIGWNAGAWLYLILAARLMFGSSHERMRARALQDDEGQLTLLALVVVAALMCLGALVVELGVARQLKGTLFLWHIGLTALTILSSWAFTQVMFTLHYASLYYAPEGTGHHGGLIFPGGHQPDYADFLYVACVIGTSGQTADVAFSTRAMRRTGLIHCVLAYFFNTTLLALTINIASGLI